MKKSIEKLFLLSFFLFLFPVLANAEEMPGARSATNSAGDVFLGGNYIEIGISKGGSFGTEESAPESFHSHATSSTNYQLGLISDGDGWDVGEKPTTGDFFLPGMPEERIILAYKLDGVEYNHIQADRVHEYWENPIQSLEVKDESDLEKGLLKAVLTGITHENVKLEITYSFNVDDKYYLTEVNITNLSDKELSDVRFVRSFDPDQDVEIYGSYETYNKVISNPVSTLEAGENNYSMVVSRGSDSLDGFFFVAFDNRARSSRGVSFDPENAYLNGLWVEVTEGLPTFSTDESLEISKENTNGYTLEDNAIAMTFNLGNLKKNESTKLNYYSSLDPNVIDSIKNILKAVSANVKKFTDTTIEIETQEGYEYSIDNGKTWQEEGLFDNLEPGKSYTILSRIKATSEQEASEPGETVITTKKSGLTTPDIKGISATEDSVTVQSKEGYEYSIDGGKTWQTEAIFTNLEADKEYEIIARYAETAETMYGTSTTIVKVKTAKHEKSELDDLTNINVDIESSDELPIISISRGNLYKAVKEDETIKQAIENNDQIDVKFIVDIASISEEDLKNIKNGFAKDEEFAFIIDATIQLYINGNYVKNIKEPADKVRFIISVPTEYIKEKRNFFVTRTHMIDDEKVEIERLKDLDDNNNTITIESDKFSNFVISYLDSNEESTEAVKNPQTGDKFIMYVSIILASAIGLALCTRKKLS